VLGTQEAGLLVHVTDGTEVTSDNLVVGLLPSIVFRHLKHAEVQVGDWAERTAGYEDEWLFGRVPQDPLQAMDWERIARWVGELPRQRCHCVAEGSGEREGG
jgi:hypothetical protein